MRKTQRSVNSLLILANFAIFAVATIFFDEKNHVIEFQEFMLETPFLWKDRVPEELILEKDAVELGVKMGCGYFGVVYKASLIQREKRRTVAVKFMKGFTLF